MASMLNCLAGIAGSIYLGKFLDRHKCFKKLQVFNAVAISAFIGLTFIGLQLDWANPLVLAIIILAGAPMSSVSVVSYQFAAEVIYPIGEVQGVSIMNTLNKLISFGLVQLTNGLTVDKPNHIKYMYGFILWVALPLIGLIPALFVREDLRRLNMKEVEKSVYIHEQELKGKDADASQTFLLEKHIQLIADEDTLQHYLHLDLSFYAQVNPKRASEHIVSQSVRLIDDYDYNNTGETDGGNVHKKQRPVSFGGSETAFRESNRRNLQSK